MTFKLNDSVQLRVGGGTMTISHVYQTDDWNEGKVEATWMEGDKHCFEVFDPSDLDLISR